MFRLPPTTWAFVCVLFSESLVLLAGAGTLWPTDLHKLERSLEVGSTEQRLDAVKVLAQLPRQVAHPLVRRFIVDDTPELRVALGTLAVASHYQDLAPVGIEWLKSSEPLERRLGVELAALHVGRAEVERIGPLVSDHDTDVQLAAISALMRVQKPFRADACDFLLTAFGDSDPSVRSAAARALGWLGVASSASMLAGQLKDPDDGVRYQVARALWAIENTLAIPGLLASLRDSEPRVVAVAAQALGQFGDKQTVPGLLEVISRPAFASPSLEAWVALLRIDPELAGRQIVSLAAREDARGLLLAWAQSEAGQQKLDVTDCLSQGVLADLRFCAELHLLQHGSPVPLVQAASEHRMTWQDVFLLLAARTNAKLDEELPVIVRALEILSLSEYQEPGLMSLRVAALGYLKSLEVLPALSRSPLFDVLKLGSAVDNNVVETLQLIGKTEGNGRGYDPVEHSTLLQLLHSTQPIVRQAAARALVQGEARVEDLQLLFNHEQGDVPLAAAEALSGGMTGKTFEWLIGWTERGVLARQSPVKLAMQGAMGAVSQRSRQTLLKLWKHTWPADRSWLIPALSAACSAAELRAALSVSTPSERRTLVQLLVRRADAAELVFDLTRDADDRLVALSIETLGQIGQFNSTAQYLDLARARAMFVEAAAVRALRAAWLRQTVKPDLAVAFAASRCNSDNAGLAAAIWGWAAEMGVSCAGQSTEERVLLEADARIRLEIARGWALSSLMTPDRRRALVTCSLYDLDSEVARLCQLALAGRGKTVPVSDGRRTPFLRAKPDVPWMQVPPPDFPHLVLVDGRPRLLVSTSTGDLLVPAPRVEQLDQSLVY